MRNGYIVCVSVLLGLRGAHLIWESFWETEMSYLWGVDKLTSGLIVLLLSALLVSRLPDKQR